MSGVTNPDNADCMAATSSNPNIMELINEDSSKGIIWMMHLEGSNRAKIGERATGKELNGVFDLSELVDYARGNIV